MLGHVVREVGFLEAKGELGKKRTEARERGKRRGRRKGVRTLERDWMYLTWRSTARVEEGEEAAVEEEEGGGGREEVEADIVSFAMLLRPWKRRFGGEFRWGKCRGWC